MQPREQYGSSAYPSYIRDIYVKLVVCASDTHRENLVIQYNAMASMTPTGLISDVVVVLPSGVVEQSTGLAIDIGKLSPIFNHTRPRLSKWIRLK